MAELVAGIVKVLFDVAISTQTVTDKFGLDCSWKPLLPAGQETVTVLAVREIDTGTGPVTGGGLTVI